MALFAIAYDLNKKKNYQDLWDELERLGAHKPLNSFYLANLNTNSTAEVNKHLKQFVDNDDYLMVIKFSERPSFIKAKAGTNVWIDKNIL